MYSKAKRFLAQQDNSENAFRRTVDKLFKKKAELARRALFEYVKHIDALISADYGNNELQNQFMSRLQELDDRSKKEENISQGIPDVNLTGFELTDYDLIKTYEQFLSEGYEAPVEHNKLSKQLVAIWTYYNFLWGAEDEIPLTVAFYFDYALTLLLEKVLLVNPVIRKRGSDKGRTYKSGAIRKKERTALVIKAYKEVFDQHIISVKDGNYTVARKIRDYLKDDFKEEILPSITTIGRYLKKEKIL